MINYIWHHYCLGDKLLCEAAFILFAYEIIIHTGNNYCLGGKLLCGLHCGAHDLTQQLVKGWWCWQQQS
jgi:hypothetical protein